MPVEAKLQEIVRQFVHRPTLLFSQLVLSARSRSELVAIFLAVLELSRARKVMIEEDEAGECTLRLATKEEQALFAPQAEDDRENHRTE